jgi:hypothetical protein
VRATEVEPIEVEPIKRKIEAEPIVAEPDTPLKKYDITVHSRFPKVLYDILEESTDRGFSDCIRWVPKGDALFVAETSFFEANFLHMHTRIRQASTFDNHMSRHGFDRISCEDSGSIYKHQYFVRGQKENLSLFITKPRKQEASNSANNNGEISPTGSIPKLTKRPAIVMLNGERETTRSIKPPTTDLIKGTTTKSLYIKTKDAENVPLESPICDGVKVSPASSDTLPILQEKENSESRVATGSVAISPPDDKNSVESRGRKLSIAVKTSPGLTTERQLFPSSAKAPGIKQSSSESSQTLSATAPKDEANGSDNFALVSGNGVRDKAQLKQSLDISRKRAMPGEIAQNKRRKIAPKPAARAKMPRNGLGHKRRNTMTNGKREPSVPRRSLRSDAGGSQNTSQERNVAAASGRELRSSTKVCGIDTMNSIIAGYIHSRKLAKVSECKIEDQTSNAKIFYSVLRNALSTHDIVSSFF